MNANIANSVLDFELPKLLECAVPTEVRNLRRDDVKLLVTERSGNKMTHTIFRDIISFLKKGDVLIVNTSGTLNAALPTRLTNSREGRIHLSTRLSELEWLVEIRQVKQEKTIRFRDLKIGNLLHLPDEGMASILEPYYPDQSQNNHLQLWKVRFYLPLKMNQYLGQHAFPIRYSNVHTVYPSAYYQTVFANEPGSSEMPSAGRAFTAELVSKLVDRGVQIAPIVLHTGVSSLETHEKPYPEYFRVSKSTAKIINKAAKEGRRIIAVGTTAIRAIESAVNQEGKVVSKEGMTNLFITPERGLQIVNAMLTGFHEPKASHLLMMEALASRRHLKLSYQAAIQRGYQWHEFGDLHLIL